MRQHLGQHFLKNAAIVEKIAAALEIGSGETIVEIGPGHGELTHALLERVSHPERSEASLNAEMLREAQQDKIIAIERDPALAAQIRERFKEKVEVIEADVLEALPQLAKDYTLNPRPYTLVGNIPYYLTGFLFRTVGELAKKPRRTVFMIQKEVAERVVAKPPEMNRLAAAVQYWADPKILFRVGKTEFDPPPEIDSAVIRLDTLDPRPCTLDPESYYRFLHVLFQQPRKTVLNNLAEGFPAISKERIVAFLEECGVPPTLRPQNLSVEDIARIAEQFVDFPVLQ